jgi:hypothetical protein
MNREEAAQALEILAASPAAQWIGNKIINGTWLQKCTRCGAEKTLEVPPDIHGPEDVPAGFDEKLFNWKRSFQIAHEECTEVSSASSVSSAPDEPPPELAPEVTVKRLLQCAKHGPRRWQGHIMCDGCGRTFQTTSTHKSGYAPEFCRCKKRLLPPEAERIGDVLGLRTGGIVLDGKGSRYQTPEAQDWTARSICYLCYRYFAKHHDGRVPVEQGRN